MKKIEITKLINEKLEKRQLQYKDMMDSYLNINSYEKYIYEFSLLRNLFKDKINEFYLVADERLNKIQSLVDECSNQDDQDVEKFMDNNILSYLIDSNYNSIKVLEILFNDSMKNAAESNYETICQIYYELGYQDLCYYIDLLRQPSQLTSYLGNSQKQLIAMEYLLYKTNHHSPKKLKRNMSTENLYSKMESDINNSIQKIIDEKSGYIDFVNEKKEEYNDWFNNTEKDYDEWFESIKEKYNNFMIESENKVRNLETTYSQKLKVEKPAEFMKEKSEEYAKKTKLWVKFTIGLSIALIILLTIIISPEIKVSKKIISINLFNTEIPIYSSIVILAIICLIIYIIRIFIKLTLSSKHLSEEYKQKYILTYFYLSLINDGKIGEQTGNIILSILFAKADTGLIKNDNSNEAESIMKILTSTGK